MTDYEKIQYLDRLRDTIYPSRKELYKMVVMSSRELNEGQKLFFYSAINGNYKPLRFLGRGGYGKVFLCQDNRNNFLAVKLAEMGNEWDRDACLSEIEINNQCKEKGILCAIPYLSGTTSFTKIKNAQLYGYQPVQFVMPIGLSYTNFIRQYVQKRSSGLSSTEACFLLYNMFSVIEEIHRNGIVHRDIKPENFMLVVSSSGNVQLMLSDFGTARIFEKTGMYTENKGTTFYIPLQLRKDQSMKMSTVDSQKQDVYAAAITAYRILDRFEPLREGTKKLQILLSYPNQTSKPSGCLDERLWDILKPIIHNSNNIYRIPTAKEVCKSLDRILFPNSKRQPYTGQYGAERQTQHDSPKPPSNRGKPTSGPKNGGHTTPSHDTGGFNPKQENPGYGIKKEPVHKAKAQYDGKQQGGFSPKKNSGGSSRHSGQKRKNGPEPDIQDIIKSLLK
ncbi:MAG: protein kinase [Ruminococcus sp.]|nr:protein kinase [Ruminococcus sp.]